MNKQQFLAAIREKINFLPPQDINRSLDYYAEMIDDRIEDGLSEEEAVAAMGSAEEIAAQILGENPPPPPAKQPRKKKTWQAWEIVLLIVGFPLWFPLLLAAAIIVLALYIVLWSAIIVLYAADLCFAAGALVGILYAPLLAYTGQGAAALLLLGAGLVCVGLTILWFIGSTAAAKGAWWLTKLPFRTGKGDAQ